ncbi:methytransferase partner Trm112 [Methanothrix sp.]|uniref:methytransferase partner Trm112 n=1 Tax=Methanothrix sp. TaxID=90426 RepID=UPI003C709BA9
MRRDLMEILVCPVCRGDLELEVFEENEREILTGRLMCRSCGEVYPIEEGIPNMLPPELRERC